MYVVTAPLLVSQRMAIGDDDTDDMMDRLNNLNPGLRWLRNYFKLPHLFKFTRKKFIIFIQEKKGIWHEFYLLLKKQSSQETVISTKNNQHFFQEERVNYIYLLHIHIKKTHKTTKLAILFNLKT